MRTALCWIVFAAASACGATDDEHLEVVFDPCSPVTLAVAGDATADEIASIDRAAQLWADVVATRIVRGAPGDAIGIRFEPAAAAFRGVYLDELGDIVINRGLGDPEQRAIVIAHELGHAFGLWHAAPSSSSVMTTGNLDTAPTVDDAAALAALWGGCHPASSTAPPPATRARP